MTLRPGKLRHYLTIQLRSDVPDAFTGIDTNLTDPVSVWGKVEPIAGLNLRNGQQITEGATHRITIWHYASLTNSHEFGYEGARYSIKTIIHDPLKVYTQVDCEQITT